MNRKLKYRLAPLLVVIMLLLFACGDNKHVGELREYIAGLKDKMTRNTQKKPELDLKFPTPVTYQSTAKRSPFEESASSGQDVQQHPLLAFSLNALQFKGTVTQNGQSKAFILAPDNKIYEVKVGDIVGDRHGTITHIYIDRIEIEEAISNDLGAAAQRIITLQLKDDSK